MSQPHPVSMEMFVDKLDARTALDREERRALLDLPFTAQRVQPKKDFVRRGEQVSHSCFVFDGMVGTFGEVRNGGRQITSVFIAGDMIDLQTLVLPEAMSALQSLTESTVLKVKHADLRALTHRYPKLAEAFWRECIVDAAIINEWVVNVGRRHSRARMAHVFCEMSWRNGHDGPAMAYPFPITQEQFADILGLTPVHVNRTLKGLREDKLVEVERSEVQILDWDKLCFIGEFDPTYLRLGLGCGDPTDENPARPIQIPG